ncbi:MAG: WG repeat-containing protein [Bacteroidales bacterium]|nr:WG repeat-containing protein [Bacteroidales bacterium]
MKKLFFVLVLAVVCVSVNAQITHVSHNADATKFGFVDDNEKWVVPAQWDNASWDAKMQVGIVGDFKGPKGAINVKGQYILEIKYSKIRTNPQSQTLLVAEDRNGVTYWGVFDKEGKPILPLEYKAVLFNRTTERFECTTMDNQKKVFTAAGEEVK